MTQTKSSDQLALLVERGRSAFAQRYGVPPAWAATAPGRVNIIGEHTDYNDGFVLPMAINRRTVALAAFNHSTTFNVYSATNGSVDSFDASIPVLPAHAGYVRGVARGFQNLNVKLSGLDILIDSDVPLGGGLSSSAALEVAIATLLEAAAGYTLDPRAKALLCQKAENDFAGVPCGIMDQMASTLSLDGRLILLDCRSLAIEYVPFANQDVLVLIINTNVRHELAEGQYALRRESCRRAASLMCLNSLRDATMAMLNHAHTSFDELTFRRARHVLLENQRALDATLAFRAGDWPTAGRLMYESHDSLRYDYEVSCAELDIVVDIARELSADGVYGCRMTGGGFGGCAVALIKADDQKPVAEYMQLEYYRRAKRHATLYLSEPSSGASLYNLGRADD